MKTIRQTHSFQTALSELMKLAVETNTAVDPIPQLRNTSIGYYTVGIELDRPYMHYCLSVAKGKEFTLSQVREIETKLQTKLLA